MEAALVYDAETSVTTSPLRSRHPAQVVMEKTLAEQQSARPRSAVARLFGATPLAPSSTSWFDGAKGELQVGEILARLPSGWQSFHSLPVGRGDSDIDHVVIGPAGVFTINTKRHRGSVWIAGSWVLVDGHKKPGYVPAAEYESKRMERMLAAAVDDLPPVRPVLAFVEPKRLVVRRRPDRVAVLNAKHLVRWLTAQPAVWTDEQRLRVVRAVDALAPVTVPSAWPSDAVSAPMPGADVVERFRALEAEVHSAHARRTAWVVAGSTGLIAACATLAGLLGTALSLVG